MHFLYARFPTAQDRTAVEWMRVVDDVVMTFPALRTQRPDARHTGPVLAWRLLSENNREIARGGVLFATEGLARADTDRLMRAHRDLIVHPAPALHIRGTGWFATLGDELVMMSARRYENRSAARGAGALAVRLVSEMADGKSTGPTVRTVVEPAL